MKAFSPRGFCLVLLVVVVRGQPAGLALPPLYSDAAPVLSIEDLRKVSIPNTTIDSVTVDTVENSCRVVATVTHPPANDRVKVFVALPLKNWNGRFRGNGGAGFLGGNPASLRGPVTQGFAVGATDTGHEGGGGSFALNANGRLNWQDWPEWRGASGDGTVTTSGAASLRWSAEENLLWTASLPAPGNSSPIVAGSHVFVTGANADGTERSLFAFDRAKGALLWQRSVAFAGDDPTHATNPWCAATPATDGQRVFVWNGSAGATAYDYQGRKLWHRDLGTFVHQWGHASSPRIHRDTVIVFGSPGPRVLLTALKRETGETVWERTLDAVASAPQELRGSFATPLLWRNGSRTELLLPLPGYLASFDPDTGEELWRCEGLGPLSYTDVMAGPGVLLAFSGFRGPAIGLRAPAPEETGNLTGSHRIWNKDTAIQRMGSGVIVGRRFYLSGRRGELECGNIFTGEIIWTQPLREQAWGAISRVGEVLALTDHLGRTHLFEAADTYRPIRINPLGPGVRTNSTPAFAGDQVFLRSFEKVYAFALVADAAN